MSPFIGKELYLSQNESFNHLFYSDATNSSFIEKLIAYPLGTKVGFKDFNFWVYFENLKKNILSITFIGAYPFFILSLLSFLLIVKEGSFHKKEKFLVISLLIFFELLFFYGPKTTFYGFNTHNLGSSLYRYFLLIFILLSIIFTYFINYFIKINSPKFNIYFFSQLLIIYLLFSFSFSIKEGYRGVYEINHLKEKQLDYLKYTLSLDNDHSIFICGPNTERYTYLLDNEIGYRKLFNYYIGERYFSTEMEKKLFLESIKIFNLALEKGYDIYFIYSPFDQTSQKRYFDFLTESFDVVKINEPLNSEGVIFYKLNKRLSS